MLGAEQQVPDVFRPAKPRVTQREFQALDGGVRVKSVQPALVPREILGDDDMPVAVRGPRVHGDRVPDAHLPQLREPRAVAIPGEPDVRVPAEVALQIRRPLVETAGGISRSSPSAAFSPTRKAVSCSSRPAGPARPGGASASARATRSRSALVLCRVQLRGIQARVPGQDVLQYLGYHIGLAELERRQEMPGIREPRDSPPHGRQARRPPGPAGGPAPAGRRPGGRRASKGATWLPSSSRMIGFDLAGPGSSPGIVRCSPQGQVLMQEGVEAPDPLIWLRRQELGVKARDEGCRRDLGDADLLAQVPPEGRRPVGSNGLVREGAGPGRRRAARPADRGTAARGARRRAASASSSARP